MTTTDPKFALGQAQHKALDALYGARSYKQAGITLRRSKGKTTAFFEGVEILSLCGSFSREEFGMALKAKVDQFHIEAMLEVDAVLRQKLVVPAGHSYRQDIDHSTRFGLLITSNHSAFIRHDSGDLYYPDQVACEFRVFMDEPRAMLFLEYGPKLNFQSKPLLGNRCIQIKAGTYAELAEQLVARFAEGMANLELLKANIAAAA